MTDRVRAPTMDVMPDDHELAQGLAVVLLGLDALAAKGSSEDAAGTIAALREHVAQTLELCRALAVGLRPPLLDQLDLLPALETEVYRTVEEALRSVGGRRSMSISLDGGLHELCLGSAARRGHPGRRARSAAGTTRPDRRGAHGRYRRARHPNPA